MIITLCILVLVYLIKGKPIDGLLQQLKDVDWKSKFIEIWDKLKTYALRAGPLPLNLSLPSTTLCAIAKPLHWKKH